MNKKNAWLNWRKTCVVFLKICCVAYASHAQKVYEIDANVPEMKIYSGHLKLGGTNPKGERITVNNHYVAISNKPFIPITGEFHFSRYSNKYWDESIKKMKAGGINVIATYVFWNIHEENEGRFNWTGDKDVRKFVELCARNNIYAIVRIGPFCHGEIRNGGLPDWLMGKPLSIRSNDPNYLAYVERLYNETGKQLKGLYYKNGGPIIGIQIENEYQHSAAPWGLMYPGQPYDWTASEQDLSVTQQGVGIAQSNNPYASLGNEHMKVLKSLAVKAGIDVPLYTATGWGNAAIIPNESIPVTAAYAYPFWTPRRDLSPFFLYKDMHKVPDYAPVRYKPEDYPAFPAELGSGIMSVYTRRPIAVHKSFDALINRCIGSGANGVGYYMYHGGSTPKGEHYYLSDEAYGLPKTSYDFQAPIGEYGQVREGFHRLKLIHFFLQDFGDILAPTQTVLPANASTLTPENINDLRYAARIKESSGFLFLNNFQDDTTLPDKQNIQVRITLPKGIISFPETGGFTLKTDENVIFPFNFNLNGINLNYATAQLLMKGDDPMNPYYVFFTPDGILPEFSFGSDVLIVPGAGSTVNKNSDRSLVKCNDGVSEFTVSLSGKGKTKILVLPKSIALQSYIVRLNGKKYLMMSEAVVLQEKNSFTLLSNGKNQYNLSVYPAITRTPKISSGIVTKSASDKLFSTYSISFPEQKFTAQTRSIGEKKYVVALPKWNPGLSNLFLTIDYTGDTGMGFLNGELVTDEFYKGIPWQIGLRNFLPNTTAKEMVFYFRPMDKDASYLIDLQPYPASIPDFGKQRTYLKINNTYFTPEYKTVLTF
jgi:beta-galactosidase